MSDPQQHWADHKERGSFRLMKLTAWGIKLLGRRVLAPVLYAIVLYFFLFGKRARRSIWLYQQRLADWSGATRCAPRAAACSLNSCALPTPCSTSSTCGTAS
jgi:predicted LPLAT superfamily acyltransferase